MPPSAAQDDYDSPWKEAVEHAFPEFMEFYFPEASRQIDWASGHRFLDKELQQIVRDAALGRRHVDKLVSVTTHSGEEDWLCVHIEVQGSMDPGFARRMFVYNYRIFDTYERLGCRHSLQFPVVKLVDHAADETALLRNPNPFALVSAAHLYARRTRRSPAARFDAKRRLVRLLYERNWTRQRILNFFSVLDWMMRLPRELEQGLWQDIESIEGERKVKYVTSVERLAIERGLRKGMEQGLEIGIEKGIEQGRAQGTASVLLRLLNRRFGPLSPDITRRLSQSTPEQLEIWAERVLDARAIDEVFAETAEFSTLRAPLQRIVASLFEPID
jgi:hypothetical protein